MWFQVECAAAYQRLGKWGEALKKCHEIDRVSGISHLLITNSLASIHRTSLASCKFVLEYVLSRSLDKALLIYTHILNAFLSHLR